MKTKSNYQKMSPENKITFLQGVTLETLLELPVERLLDVAKEFRVETETTNTIQVPDGGNGAELLQVMQKLAEENGYGSEGIDKIFIGYEDYESALCFFITNQLYDLDLSDDRTKLCELVYKKCQDSLKLWLRMEKVSQEAKKKKLKEEETLFQRLKKKFEGK